jgi:hypothetical protein
MKHYKNPHTGEVFAYETQEERNNWGAPELVEMSLNEVADHLHPPVQPSQLLSSLMSEYEKRMQIIAAGYPPSERESWPVQTSEAYALLADVGAVTPWIDAAAAARGLTRVELATRIASKNAAYRVVSGTLTGVRQRIEDEISAAGTDPQALAAIDVTVGWPAL